MEYYIIIVYLEIIIAYLITNVAYSVKTLFFLDLVT